MTSQHPGPSSKIAATRAAIKVVNSRLQTGNFSIVTKFSGHELVASDVNLFQKPTVSVSQGSQFQDGLATELNEGRAAHQGISDAFAKTIAVSQTGLDEIAAAGHRPEAARCLDRLVGKPISPVQVANDQIGHRSRRWQPSQRAAQGFVCRLGAGLLHKRHRPVELVGGGGEVDAVENGFDPPTRIESIEDGQFPLAHLRCTHEQLGLRLVRWGREDQPKPFVGVGSRHWLCVELLQHPHVAFGYDAESVSQNLARSFTAKNLSQLQVERSLAQLPGLVRQGATCDDGEYRLPPPRRGGHQASEQAGGQTVQADRINGGPAQVGASMFRQSRCRRRRQLPMERRRARPLLVEVGTLSRWSRSTAVHQEVWPTTPTPTRDFRSSPLAGSASRVALRWKGSP
jgi:hypothetical protein